MTEAFANSAAARLVAQLRAAAEREPRIHDSRLLNALTAHSNEVAMLGFREQALELADEAVDLADELMERYPGGRRTSYAAAMNNLGLRLAEIGRADDALAVTAESVEVSRDLDRDEPDLRAGGLGIRLLNYSARLLTIGRYAEALDAVNEALDLARAARLVRKGIHQELYGKAMANRTLILARLGRRVDALDSANRAVNISRMPPVDVEALDDALNMCAMRTIELYHDPDGAEAHTELALLELVRATHAAAFDVAFVSRDYVERLRKAGRLDAALEASTAAVAGWRAIAAIYPASCREELGLSMRRHARILFDLDQPDEALAVNQELVALYRSADAKPIRYGMELARALLVLASRYPPHRAREALAAAEEALDLIRPLATAVPDGYARDLAPALSECAYLLGRVDRHADGVPLATEAVEIRRALAKADPLVYAEALTRSLGVLAARLDGAGRSDEARAVRSEAEAMAG